MQNVIDIFQPGFHSSNHFINKGPVIHHHQMGVKNRGTVLADRYREFFLYFEQLVQ